MPNIDITDYSHRYKSMLLAILVSITSWDQSVTGEGCLWNFSKNRVILSGNAGNVGLECGQLLVDGVVGPWVAISISLAEEASVVAVASGAVVPELGRIVSDLGGSAIWLTSGKKPRVRKTSFACS